MIILCASVPVPQQLLIGEVVFPYWPRSVENRAALRTAIAALTAVLISFAFHLQTPYWSGMSVVIVSNLYTGSIIDKAMMRIIGTLAGAFLGFFIAGLVTNSFLLYFLSCFLIIAVAVYYYHYSRYGYAYLLGALCAFIVISQLALNPQNAFFVAIWRPVEIGIGVLVAAISAYAVFPNHLKDNILLQVHDIFDDFSKELDHLYRLLQQGAINFNDIAQNNLNIKKKIRKAVELIGALNHELGVTQEKTDELRAFLDSFYALSRQLQYLIITSPREEDLNALQSLPLDSVFSAIRHDLALLQTNFSHQHYGLMELHSEQAITELEQQFIKERSRYPAKNDFIYSFVHFLQQVNKHLVLMQSLMNHEPVPEDSKFKMIGKQQQLRFDLDLIKHSIKAGLSVILALSFWLVTNWPGGLNGIISSLIISIRNNLYEMTHISIHRIIGCFLGGGIALSSLFIFEMDLFDFMVILFFSVWGFSFLMFKSIKYSYIGLQANIALIISLAQEGGPPVLLDPPLQRLGGIMIGIVASFIVANILWRSDVWTILNRYLAKLYDYLTFNLKQVLSVSGKQKTLHDLAHLFWTVRGLIESLNEESLTAKKREKLTGLRQRFESMVLIQATISHILVSIEIDKAEACAARLGLDLVLCTKTLVCSYEQKDAGSGAELSHKLQDFLAKIEQNTAYSKENDDDLRIMLAYVNALNQLALRIQ